MADLSAYMDGIEQRITDARTGGDPKLAGAVILREDRAELEEAIKEAIETASGLVILIGQPPFDNNGQSMHVANMNIRSAIAIGENPTLWRAEGKPVAMDVTQRVAELLQGFVIPGFQPLRVMRGDPVPDKKRQLWELQIESQFLIQITT